MILCFVVVVVVAAAREALVEKARVEVPLLEERRSRESTGIVHNPLVYRNDSELLLAHAKLACYFDQVENAEASFAKSAELSPNNAATWHGLGRVKLGRGKDEEAANAFRRAADLDPSSSLLPLLFEATAIHLDYTRSIVCDIFEAVSNRIGENEVKGLCDSLYEARTIGSDSSNLLEGKGYLTLTNVLPIDVHQRLLVPWYKRLFEGVQIDFLKKSGTDGIVLDTLHVNDMVLSVHARWHPANQRVELWGEPIADILNHLLTPHVQRAMGAGGQRLIPTYPWPIHYGPDGMIDLHLDQSDNEISLSYQVRVFRKRTTNAAKKSTRRLAWPLHFIDSGLTLEPGENGPPTLPLDARDVQSSPAVVLSNNAGALYRGREVVHWRPPQDDGIQVYQLVFAWRRVHQKACHGSL